VQLRSARNVLADHFWIGVGEAAANGKNGHGHSRTGNGRRNGKH
jgi:hypothetical protein